MGMRSTFLAAVFSFGATAAFATPVVLQNQDPNSLFAGGGFQTVTVQSGSTQYKVDAGGFRVTDGASKFIAWCVDLANVISLPSKYTTTDTPFSGSSGTYSASVQDNLKKLFNTSYSTLDLNNNTQSAAFQIALWEIVTEGQSNLSTWVGDFKVIHRTDAMRLQAEEYLANLSGPVTQQYEFSFFESALDSNGKQLSQNLVSVAPIPLPAAVWMLGGGIVLLGAVARRRRKAETA